LKYILYIPLILLVVVLVNNSQEIIKNTEVTVTIPQLSSVNISNHLKNEFDNYNNVDFVNESLISNTIVLHVDELSYNEEIVDNILYKWGCEATDYYYRKLFNSE